MARNLVGLEMLCFGKSKHFTIEYAGGGYVDERGRPVDDVVDMNCYVCTQSFYTREGDFIPYCPNCGHVDRKRFDDKASLIEFFRGFDMSWLKRNGLQAVVVQTWDGDWQLTFAKSPEALDGTGQYKSVHKF